MTSARYAKALLAFAKGKGEDAKVFSEMQNALDAMQQLPQIVTLLSNPAIAVKQKGELILSACAPKGKPSESIKRFVTLLLGNGRPDIMHFIASSFIALYQGSNKLIKGKLTVPCAVSEKLVLQLKALVEKRSGSKVDFDVRIDEALGGGFVLEYDTYRLDASVKTRIKQLERTLLR